MIGAFIPGDHDPKVQVRRRQQIQAVVEDSFVQWFIEQGDPGYHMSERDELGEAIRFCRTENATFVIGSVKGLTDRKWKSLELLQSIADQGIAFMVADDPTLTSASIDVAAARAKETRNRILKRSSEGLERIRNRIAETGSYTAKSGRVMTDMGGKVRGSSLSQAGNDAKSSQAEAFANDVWVVVEPLYLRGVSQTKIAEILNKLGVKTFYGRRWHQSTVRHLIERFKK